MSFNQFLGFVLLVLVAATGNVCAEKQAQADLLAGAEHVTFPAPTFHPDWFKHSFLDLSEDIQEAQVQDKRLIVYFYQAGCPYCKKLIEHNLGQAEVSEYAQENFEIVAIDIFGSVDVTDTDGEVLSEKEFAKKLRVNFTPTMLVYNENSKIIFRMNGYYNLDKFSAMLSYLAQKMETQVKFLDYLAEYRSKDKPGQLDTDVFTGRFKTAPFDLQKTIASEAKPVAVFFEEANCPYCDELHGDILQREETEKFLEKFSLAVIDIHSEKEIVSPAGGTHVSKDWVREKKVQFIPTILFFDRSGNEVFRVDGYMKAFHLQTAFDYVLTESYKTYPGFQPFLHDRADKLESEGVVIQLMQ